MALSAGAMALLTRVLAAKKGLTAALHDYEESLTTAEDRLESINRALQDLDAAGASTVGYLPLAAAGQSALSTCEGSVGRARSASGSYGEYRDELVQDCEDLIAWLDSTGATEGQIEEDISPAQAGGSGVAPASSGRSGSSGSSRSSGRLAVIILQEDSVFLYSSSSIVGCKYKGGPAFLTGGEVAFPRGQCEAGAFSPKKASCPEITITCR